MGKNNNYDSGGRRQSGRRGNGCQGQRKFPKFVDRDRRNRYRSQNDWKRRYDEHDDNSLNAHFDYGNSINYNDNNSNNNNGFRGNEEVPAASNIESSGIHPWTRKSPVRPLIIPKNHEIYVQENELSKKTEELQHNNMNKQVEYYTTTNNNDVPSTTAVKQEKGLTKQLKQEKKSSSSSSSSSSSESSSSEGEPEEPPKKPAAIVKTEPTQTKPTSSPLIKLKPKESSLTLTPVKATPKPPSSSSSSSEEEETSPPSPKPTQRAEIKVTKQETKTKTSKNKISSEDEVLCMGNLENKIVLEDDSDCDDTESEEQEEELAKQMVKKSTKAKKVKKKTLEKCMLCDKKGHTSFECQMICKNCSAPYHGYRTCPQPANLNTMLQLFMEFSMQQLQHFNSDNLIAPNSTNGMPKPQIESPHLTSIISKTNKLKRKTAAETNAKTKKRKLSITKKKASKRDSDDSSDDDEDDTESAASSSKSEDDSANSPVESQISSKKKLKIKNKNNKSMAYLSKLANNPVNLPLVLNGYPNLTVAAPNLQTPTSSSNALNTLLLTQMLQNAIGSLNK